MNFDDLGGSKRAQEGSRKVKTRVQEELVSRCILEGSLSFKEGPGRIRKRIGRVLGRFMGISIPLRN